MPPEPSQPSEPLAPEEVFAEFLVLVEDGNGADIETVCVQHPSMAGELRELHRQWAQGREHLRRARVPGHAPSSAVESDEPELHIHAGTRLGAFRLERKLGQGGMGQVWQALDEQVERHVALKLIRPDRATTRTVQLFQREARAGGRLNHPNLVTVLSAGQFEGVHYIVQELVTGQRTLRDKLHEAREAAELPESYYREITELFAKVASALGVAHDAGVIHRDVKPQNILLASDDEPKVGDFGLARLVDELSISMTGDLVGTYYYMSPEQVAARRAGIDHRTDIFSLGAVLYEALSFQRPFEGDTSQQVVHQIVFEDPPDPRKLRSRVPQDLAVICAKALEKSPRQRYQSMAELAKDLRRHLNHEAIEARPPSAVRRARKWAARHPTSSTVFAVGLVSLLTISTLFVRNLAISEALAASRNEARANEVLATQKVREVLDLSVVTEVRALADEAQLLWPATPDNVDDFRAWLERADELAAKGDDYRRRLEDVRTSVSTAKPKVPWAQDEMQSRARQLDALLEAEPEVNGRIREHEAGGREGDARRLRESQANAVAWFEAEIARLGHLAANDAADLGTAEDRWWLQQLESAVAGIDALTDRERGLIRGVSPEYGRGVERRLEFALTVAERTVTGSPAKELWDEAIESIADPEQCPYYDALRISPQLGLLPIGRDPQSGLWEFVHVESGTVPARSESGELDMDGSTGIVFVLLPGGETWMGTQSEDPGGRNHDPDSRTNEQPVHAVTLAPFFLSKYELTQGQWLRLSGSNPAQNQHSELHPVENVDWSECTAFCRRLGLALPTEAQWEFACRAGTWTTFSFGEYGAHMASYANVKDSRYEARSARGDAGEPFDDGHAWDAPVGRYRPNGFGLHDMHGNVQEWCADFYGSYDMPTDAHTGARLVAPDSASGPNMRGGSFIWQSYSARSGNRLWQSATFRGQNCGMRPARTLQP